MINKSKKILVIIFILFLLLSSCQSKAKIIKAEGPENPSSEIEGFFEQHQIVNGGADESSLNLADIKITNLDENETQLVLTFAQGSPAMDKITIPSESVPKYETSFIQGINRMQLTMKGISYWTYKIYVEELEDSLIEGVFVQHPVDSEESYLYINTNCDYAYKVEEYINQIIITFHKIANISTKSAYYATLNAFDEYEQGIFGDSFYMYPTMCEDKQNVILISRPFQNKESVQKFVDENNTIINLLVPGKQFMIIEQNNYVLPTFSEDIGLLEIANTPIGYRNDNALSFAPLIANGRILGYNCDYTEYIYAQPNILHGGQEGDIYSFEYLYKANIENKSSQKLLEYQFSSVNCAKFSYDSKYIAFIEQNDVLRTLQILSLVDGKLYIPSEDSFGVDTASFVWAENKNILYAINGDFQSKQLLSYDLTNPDDVKVDGVFEQEFSESILQIKDNKIYYADSDNENLSSQICVVDINTGQTDKIADGYSFLLSPNGEGLLINDIVIIDNTENSRLRYYDITTENEVLIQSGQTISDVTWSTNGKRIYYSIYKDAGWDEQYPNQLYYYDIDLRQSIYIMDMVSGALYPSSSDDEVLIMCIFTYQKQPIPFTYIVK